MVFFIHTNPMVIVYILKIWNRWLLVLDVYPHRCRSVFHLFPQPPPPTHTFHCYLIAGGRHHLQTFYDSQSHCVIVSFADASPFFWVSLYDIEHLSQKWIVIHLYEIIRTWLGCSNYTFDALAQPLRWLWFWWCWDLLCGGCGWLWWLWSLHRADIGAGLVDAATCVWLEICTIVWHRGS